MNNTIKRQYPDLFKNKNKTKQNEQTTTRRYKQTKKKTTTDGKAKTHHPLWKRQSKKKKHSFQASNDLHKEKEYDMSPWIIW